MPQRCFCTALPFAGAGFEPQPRRRKPVSSRTTAATAITMGLLCLSQAVKSGALAAGAGAVRGRGAEGLRGGITTVLEGRLGAGRLAAICGPAAMGMVLEVAFRAPCCGLGRTTGAECGC